MRRGDGKADEDRRVRRTKGRLRDALAALVHEKPFDAIAVKEILARADVGRSAFYAHFRDKDALLASAVGETLRAMQRVGTRAGHPAGAPVADPVDAVLGFSGPLFAHVGRALAAEDPDHGGVRPATTRHARYAAVHACLRRHLEETVANALRRTAGGRASAPTVPVDLLAAHVADTFVRVLAWWVETGTPASSREADRHFRALVTPAVADAVGWPDVVVSRS